MLVSVMKVGRGGEEASARWFRHTKRNTNDRVKRTCIRWGDNLRTADYT